MLSFFRKGFKKDSNCCNIQIEEVKKEASSVNEDKKKVCCSTEGKN
jgi:hypothetical protein